MDNEDYKNMPIREMTSAILDRMKEQRYSESSLRTYRGIYDKMCDYFDRINVSQFNIDDGNKFIIEHCGERLSDEGTFKNYFRALHMASDFQHFGSVFVHTKLNEKSYSPGYAPLFNEFLSSLKDTGLAEGTIYAYEKKLFRIEGFFLDRGLTNISMVTEHHIDTYILSLAGYSKNTISFSLTCLKRLLHYSYEHGYHTQNFSEFVPHVKYRNVEKVPFTITPEQTVKVLERINNSCPLGKRNYAMILLFAQYGMRPSDVLGLTFDSLDWDKCELSFNQQKTGYRQTLPITEDVGWAIIDYLKNGRPETSSRHIFISHLPPYGKLASAASLDRIIHRALLDAGINVPANKLLGAYIFRHSKGTNLLDAGATITEIADILGHHDITSTEHYLASVKPMMRQCAREVDF